MSDGGPVRDRDGRAQVAAPINWTMLATPKARAQGPFNPESFPP